MMVLLYHTFSQLSMILCNFQPFVQIILFDLGIFYKSLIFKFTQLTFFLADTIFAFTEDFNFTAVNIVWYVIILFRLDAELSGDEICVLHLSSAVRSLDK